MKLSARSTAASWGDWLLEERSHRRAVAVLQEFLEKEGEKLIEDSLKRAVLQRDLWLVFNWLEGNHSGFAEPRLTAEELRAAQEQLRQPLAAVLSFDEPLLTRNLQKAERQLYPFLPNPKLPQFPEGTEFALIRRALLIDSSHRVVASPITESVQMRIIHREVSAITAKLLDDILAPNFVENVQRNRAWQSFYEFRLSRSLLFSGRLGGLHAVGPGERDLKTGFAAHPWDQFEQRLRPDQSFRHMTQRFPIKHSCFSCHVLPGVYSFNSFKSDFRSAMGRA